MAERLTGEYGNSYSHPGLTRMAKFYDCLPNEAIIAALSQRLIVTEPKSAHCADL